MAMGDLVLLAADGNAMQGMRAIINRPLSLGIRTITVEYLVHPERDPGVLGRSHHFLRSQISRFKYALAVFDREGCGDERPRTTLESEVEASLAANGWQGRCAAISIDPEFDAWVWSPSPRVDEALGWAGRVPDLRQWLQAESYLQPGQAKPARPKEAMEHALRAVKKPRSSARYAQIGGTVALTGCTDPAFDKFKTTLQAWFP